MTEDDKQGLIDLIVWYRDDYHKGDFGHDELIDRVKAASSDNEIEQVEKIVDGWIDY